MIVPSRRTLVISAVCAAAITGLSVIGNIAVIGYPTPARRLAIVAAVPAFPGQLLTALLGAGRGPDGFPTQNDVLPYVFTFLLWWGFVYFVCRRWARRRATSS